MSVNVGVKTLNHTTQVRIRQRLVILGGGNMRGWGVFVGL